MEELDSEAKMITNLDIPSADEMQLDLFLDAGKAAATTSLSSRPATSGGDMAQTAP